MTGDASSSFGYDVSSIVRSPMKPGATRVGAGYTPG
jgi:hypothetical protein